MRNRTVRNPRRPLTILAATDFSQGAGRGLRWAAVLAKANSDRLVAFHAFWLNPLFVMFNDADRARMRREARRRLEKAADSLRRLGADSRPLLAEDRPAHGILAAAEDAGASLIVIGTRGMGGFQGSVLGQTADLVIRNAFCPVLAIPPDCSRRPGPVRSALVAAENPDEAVHLVRTAGRFLRTAATETTWILASAYPSRLPYADAGSPTAPDPVLAAPVWKGLQRAERRLRVENYWTETAALRGDPSQAVVDAALERGVDLLIVGTRGRSGLERQAHGSVAERIVSHAPCPVLTVRKSALSVRASASPAHPLKGQAAGRRAF